MLLIFPDDVRTIVRAPAVDHYVFDIRILLIEDREYCLFKIRTLVVRRGDDRNRRVGINHNQWLVYGNRRQTFAPSLIPGHRFRDACPKAIGSLKVESALSPIPVLKVEARRMIPCPS